MAQKKLLSNGNVFKRTDNRWAGWVVIRTSRASDNFNFDSCKQS